MSTETAVEFEPFVSAAVVAEHLQIEPRLVLALTRKGKLPAHPVDPDAGRKIWRYKLSEIERAMNESERKNYNRSRSPRSN